MVTVYGQYLFHSAEQIAVSKPFLALQTTTTTQQKTLPENTHSGNHVKNTIDIPAKGTSEIVG